MLLERPWSRFWPKYADAGFEVTPRPLYEFLTARAAKSPGKTCIRYQGATLTYGEVEDWASRFAGALHSLGLQKGDRVALFMPNIPQFVMSYFGILEAGGIVVPCSPIYKARELEYQLKDSGASFLVAANDVVRGNDLYASVEASRDEVEVKVITASVTDFLPSMKRRLAGSAAVKNVERKNTTRFKDLVRKHPRVERPAEVEPSSDVAVLQYTGGTTGIAKGAMLTHANLYSNAAVLSRWLPLSETDVCLGVLPLFHIYGMTAVMNATLCSGATMVLLPRFEVEAVMDAIEHEKVTTFCGVPTMYIAVINDPNVSKFKLGTVKGCISGGAALPGVVRKSFKEVTGGTLVEGYGLSESSPVTHCNPLGEGAVVKDGSIGIPIPLTDARIVDMDDPSKVLSQGEAGELAVKGPQVMKGYWNRGEETAQVLRDGWLLTGDIAKMDEDGYFYIVDRKKDMINVSGLKVYPREVEEWLFTHPAVKEAAVVGAPDDYRGEAVHAYIVLKPGEILTEQEVISFCRSGLASYKAPKKVFFVDQLPKSLIGKVLRRTLREQAAKPAT